jgi:hypothetical protein
MHSKICCADRKRRVICLFELPFRKLPVVRHMSDQERTHPVRAAGKVETTWAFPAAAAPLLRLGLGPPADDDTDGVRRIDGRHVYQYLFNAQVGSFTQLLPNYMHVRFSDAMLVSPSRMPKDDVFERRDNYYVYLKPSDVTDDTILKKMKFSGKPPVWIPMPPH